MTATTSQRLLPKDLADIRSIVDWLEENRSRIIPEAEREDSPLLTLHYELATESIPDLSAVSSLLEAGHLTQAASIAAALIEKRIVSKYVGVSEERAVHYMSKPEWAQGAEVEELAREALHESDNGAPLEFHNLTSSRRILASLSTARLPWLRGETNPSRNEQSLAAITLANSTKAALQNLHFSAQIFGADEDVISDLGKQFDRLTQLSANAEITPINWSGAPNPDEIDTTQIEFESHEFFVRMNQFLRSQGEFLRAALNQCTSGRPATVAPLILATSNTASAISLLSRRHYSTEATMLARGLFERALNVAYAVVADEEEFDRFEKWVVNKTYENLNRTNTAGDLTLAIQASAQPDGKTRPALQEAQEIFNEGELSWTRKSRDERIAIVRNRTETDATCLQLLELSIYGDSSEALHGTLYGSIFHVQDLGGADHDDDEDRDVRRHVQTKLTSTLLLCATAVSEVVEVVTDFVDANEIQDAAHENTRANLKVVADATGMDWQEITEKV